MNMIIELITQMLLAYIATACFGIILNIPHQALNVAGLVGATSWLVYWLLRADGFGLAMCNIVAAIVIGVLSLIAAKKKRMPMIVFNIPALVPYVPGGQAYQVVRQFVFKNYAASGDYLVQVLTIAGSVAVGFLLSELLMKIIDLATKRIGQINAK